MRNRYSVRLVALFAVAVIASVSQVSAQTWVWSRGAGGPRTEWSGNLGLDSAASSYIVGVYKNSITFGDFTTFSNGQDTGFYIAKYNSFGALQWAAQGNGAGAFHDASIAVDRAGNCWVAGSFARTVKLGDVVLTSQGGDDIFIARYSYYGILLWARRIGGSGDDRALAVAADSSGGMVITGSFTSGATIGGATHASAGGADLFVARYDTAGEPSWGMRAGGSGDDQGRGVCVARTGHIYVAGAFEDTVSLAGSALISAGDADVLLARLDADGVAEWAVRYGSSGIDMANAAVVDGAGACHIAGRFSGSVAFGGLRLAGAGGADLFVAKVESSNAVRWAVGGGGAGDDEGTAVALDTGGVCYVAGRHSAGRFGAEDLASSGGADIVAAAISADGAFAWARGAGGPMDDRATGIGADGGEVFVTGTFDSVATFGDDSATARGGADVFVGRLGAPSTIRTSEILGSPFCELANFTVRFTTTGVYYAGNVFTAQLSDSAGSFSSPVDLGSLPGTEGGAINVSLPLGVLTGTRYRIRVNASQPEVRGLDNGADLAIYGPVKPVISPGGQPKLCSGGTLTLDAGAGYASYQWSNGAVTRTISVSEAGPYSVIVTNDGGCVGTSDPVQVQIAQSPEKPTIIRNGSMLESSPGETYQWLRNGQLIDGANDRRYIVTEPGIYAVRVTNANGCGTTSDPVVIASGVDVRRALTGVAIGPQPCREYLAIHVPLERPVMLDISLYDTRGQRVARFSEQTSGADHRARLDVAALPAGHYLVHIAAGERSWAGAIIKQ